MESQSSFDPSLFSGISASFDPLDNFGDPVTFTDLALDEDPLFPADWDQQETPPEGNLYSTPLSWDEPKIEPLPASIPPTNYTTMNTLTPAQQEKLRKIAMPSHLQYRGQNSPNSTTSGKSRRSISSPETHDDNAEGNARSRKRKSSASADDEEEDEDDDSNPPAKKTAHNMIEKRYRVNLNDKIAALRESVPSLRIMRKSQKGEDTADDRENLQGLQPAHKLNKATILAKATEYIQHLEKRNKRYESENKEQKARLNAFETLFRSGSMGFNPQPMPSYQFNPDYSTPGPSPIAEVQGMIPVPENMQRLHRQMPQGQAFAVPQQDYYPRQQVNQNGWNNNYMQKMMIGGLASLMILEGFREAEQEADSPGSRGLFAMPVHLIKVCVSSIHNSANINMLGYHISGTQVFGYLKLFLCIGALVCLIVPYWFSEQPKPKAGKEENTSLAAAPSLASPIQVRRQAWLTAIQTVWVPGHNFLLELLALCRKSMKLSIRNIIGVYWYCRLTQTTEQQEEARIKAWEIALDAQLAGGDVEVNKRRLTLTLLASGTLPDTPARLMLKALHIRVLLLAAGNAGFDRLYLFQELAANLARVQWNEARLLHQLMTNTKSAEGDKLPSYLATLLELECDDVLGEAIGQRAYNLTWNLPTTHNVTSEIDGMDSVIDDFAIRSPLDAVAAWYSTLVLQRALTAGLVAKEDDSEAQKAVGLDIALAIKTAPIGSTAQSRALVARSVLVKQKRGLSIAESMRALGLDRDDKKDSVSNLVNTKTSTDTPPDIRMALKYAIAIAHLDRFPAPKNPSTARQIITQIRPEPRSLVGFTAAYKLMQALAAHDVVSVNSSSALERLAGTLRIWVGSEEGGRSGLGTDVKGALVERCLGITRSIVGMEDDGYESMPEGDEGEGC